MAQWCSVFSYTAHPVLGASFGLSLTEQGWKLFPQSRVEDVHPCLATQWSAAMISEAVTPPGAHRGHVEWRACLHHNGLGHKRERGAEEGGSASVSISFFSGAAFNKPLGRK